MMKEFQEIVNTKAANKKILSVLGYTNIHLDFHTPAHQGEVGRDFDKYHFAKQLKEANVDSITFFAKCYRGFSYYNTKVGTRHPGLDFDFLQAVIEACHVHDIRVLAYLSVTLDCLAADNNPGWLQCDSNGKKLYGSPEGTVSWVCLNSPYTEELFLPQIRELLEYDIDGFYFDELFYHQDACTCRFCKENMEVLGMNPDNPKDRKLYTAKSCENFAERVMDLIIKEQSKELLITYNPSTDLLGNMPSLARYENVVALGGHEAGWGNIQMPMYARYVRNLSLPVLGQTGIFHKRWGDFGTIKHEAQLRYELAERLAHHFSISVGDHLRPRGVLNEQKYKIIGKAFKEVKKLALPEAVPVRDIAIVYPGNHQYIVSLKDITTEKNTYIQKESGLVGAIKFLCDTHQQFDVLDEELADKLLNKFKLVIFPETGILDPKIIKAIRLFVKDGGALLVTGDSSLNKEGFFGLGDVLGLRYRGLLPYSSAFISLKDYEQGVPEIETVSYSGFLSVALEGALAKAYVVVSSAGGKLYTVRSDGPPERFLDAPAITYNRFGKGEVVYIGTDLFTQYYSRDYHGHRALLNNIITSLQKVRILSAPTAPASVNLNAMNTAEGMYVHLTNYHSDPVGGTLPRITSWPPPMDVTIRVYAPEAKKVIPITDVKIEFEHDKDYIQITLHSIKTHEIIRIE